MFPLPAELVDLIIDNVDAHEDLKTLILVSHTFLSAGQWRLFRCLTLGANTVAQLSEVLSQSPHLASYVRDLHISLRLNQSENHVPLVNILRLLIGVKRVAISGEDWQFWFWTAWPTELRAAIISLLSLPAMHSLAVIRCCGVPAALLWHAFACYKEVVLQIGDLDLALKVKFGKSCEPKSLDHLVLIEGSSTDTPDVHTFFLSPAVNSASAHLQHLEIALPSRQHADSLEIVSKYAASLQHLTISFFWDLPPTNLPVLPRLRTLNFRASVVRLGGTLRLLMTQLPSIAPRLELLGITLTSNIPNYPGEYPVITAADDALASLAQKNLREVRLTVDCIDLDAKRFGAEIKEKLPRTDATGILSFRKIPKSRKWVAMKHFSDSGA
ncbi:hypothetical protein DFH08DRAFT_937694 [Mycena albidolilacea]|uniref:Uncharacterized protein n=1 Tax=Mycena albidolilacea TaxID=1033008 RepID=A0AAD7EPI9_9AGAR|nr:hypothetical protein DFH08DRAFT_937694 [Mycena albidolilacea]